MPNISQLKFPDGSLYDIKDATAREVTGNLGDLAFKDNASVDYTPQGSVTQPSFTGAEGNLSVSGTPSGEISIGNREANYTPSGSVSTPTITVNHTSSTGFVASSANGGGSVTNGTSASATMPVLTTNVENETLVIGWTEGSFTTNTPTAVTLPSFSEKSIVESIESAESTTPVFSGDGVDLAFQGNALTSTGKFTPNGTVSQPTFNGTQETIVVS